MFEGLYVALVTPFHEGRLHEDKLRELVRFHIKAGTDVNTKDSAGWTPLHLAAMGGHVEIIAALIDAGADPNAAGQMGKTPLVVAQEKRQDAVIQMLQPAGQNATGGRPLVDGGLGVSGVLDAF